MNQNITSRKEAERLGAKYGAKPMPRDHPVHSEGPSIIFSSRTPKQQQQKGTRDVDRREITPLDAPTPADTDTSILNTPVFIKHDEVIPGVRVPKYLPRDSVFIAMVEWPLRLGDSRVEAYFIGTNSGKKHWFLMRCTVDDLSPYETKYLSRRTIAMVKKGGLKSQEAAVLLLKCAWQYEKETWGTPPFFMVSDCGLLDLTTVHEIADIVWPEDDGGVL